MEDSESVWFRYNEDAVEDDDDEEKEERIVEDITGGNTDLGEHDEEMKDDGWNEDVAEAKAEEEEYDDGVNRFGLEHLICRDDLLERTGDDWALPWIW